MIGVAGSNGILRMVADDHGATDVLLGWSVGAFSGYVCPLFFTTGLVRVVRSPKFEPAVSTSFRHSCLSMAAPVMAPWDFLTAAL